MTMLSLLSLLAIFAFWLREPICWYLLNDSFSEPPIYSVLGWHGNFRYWHTLVLLLFNPAVLVNYAIGFDFLYCFGYSCCLLLYAFICYFVGLLVVAECAAVAYDNLRQYNRGSLFRHSFYVLRCRIRDVREGHSNIPHMLQSSLFVCFLWSATRCALSDCLMVVPICIFAIRRYVRCLHCGVLCRLISVLVVLICGLLACVPATVLCITLAIEAIHPTMGDDECVVVADADPVAALHPGYVGTERLLDSPARMAPDGLCLYHCLVAARDYVSYVAMSVPERVTLAEQLRQKSINILKEHGLASQAERLSLSGKDGYPDEPDFLYIAMASGAPFEVAGISPGYVPHYGTSPIAARVLF